MLSSHAADLLTKLSGKINVSVTDIINGGSVPFMCPKQCDSEPVQTLKPEQLKFSIIFITETCAFPTVKCQSFFCLEEIKKHPLS